MWQFSACMFLAAILGGLIGLEREVMGKPAGMRTNMLICVGAALFTYLSIYMAAPWEHADPTRIAAQVVTGIGFLGAGTIIRARGSIHGMTTAASIWAVAAVGMAVGAGYFQESLVVTLVIMIVLHGFIYLERWINGSTEKVAKKNRPKGGF